ncbi:MAG: NifB/NifX family molybdenum-iron cluster-binding protein [Demequinaceae bacterium]|nr:NifB/NifX family molybdenum-iron cluster-binding protein [Demequinaceae bacterium]
MHIAPGNSVREASASLTTIAVCAEGPTLSDRVHDRFGRAGCFQLVDPETMTVVVISNDENRGGTEGAGIGAVELLVEHGAQVAIVTKVGPKAADAFRRTAIPVYTAAGLTVGEAVAAFGRGELTRLDFG